MRRFFALALLLACFAAESAFALRTGDTTVIIPIIGRFPGNGGTQWRTDVFLGNRSANTVSVTLKFYSTTGFQQASVVMTPYSVLSYPDICLNTFGAPTAAGPLEVAGGSAFIEARARIYNSGNPAGQFGQNAPGLGKQYLARQAYFYGLSGINGNRVNVGVTNPNDTTVEISLIIQDKNNVPLHSHSFALGPHSNVQFNDIFTTFAITPQDGVQVQFNEFDDVIYGYASEVRNDTGDAIFVFGTSPNV